MLITMWRQIRSLVLAIYTKLKNRDTVGPLLRELKNWFLPQLLESDNVHKSRRMRIDYLPEWDARR